MDTIRLDVARHSRRPGRWPIWTAPTAPTAPASKAASNAPGDAVIDGYASIFDHADDGGDLIRPGAFARSLADRAARDVKLLWQHDPTQPVGTILALGEDARGLHVRARVMRALRPGAEALALLRVGALDGLSIGFRARHSGRDPATGLRILTDVDLIEVSLVTFPMQRLARVHRLGPWPPADTAETTEFAELAETGAPEDSVAGLLPGLSRLERAMTAP
ncbi:hypothetical protein EV659_103241 [Rhodothalassium salexigens DSM 2132]|uniref:Prohead serine protease domain-containing protein n=1 Tax=Rhodothalassium salexigens DSM 2132 TaxID=1188247 RepID=A0A4R2PQ61_RHOSA|nr:HK97 family phage prohead protease [Rhodothalassium salexigens]MBB4210991.1 hypothetical protein [Rhodothalassium salexigens DSM 2132]MBK1638722.1 hypothetical protein [Rhodothalassium salexigens DSM 2132]TCP36351.1 hypothetical protein EV659_103241 [Rhodothalassium salexigens DSM 2132]